MQPFTFGGKHILRLDCLSYWQKFPIFIEKSAFYYTIEQLAFLSPIVLSHFKKSTDPFYIEPPLLRKDSFVACFQQLDSLLHSKTELQITYENCEDFTLISEHLNNCFLSFACVDVSKNKNQKFSFSFQHLLRLNTKTHNFLKNFTLNINSHKL